MQYFSTFCLSLFLLTFGSVVVAQSPDDSQTANTYEPEFAEQYSQECIQTSMGEGLDKVAADKLCGCTINKFQAQYTQAEFVELTAASASDEAAKAQLLEVGQLCFEQTLSE